jgi:hypothetical protein
MAIYKGVFTGCGKQSCHQDEGQQTAGTAAPGGYNKSGTLIVFRLMTFRAIRYL